MSVAVKDIQKEAEIVEGEGDEKEDESMRWRVRNYGIICTVVSIILMFSVGKRNSVRWLLISV